MLFCFVLYIPAIFFLIFFLPALFFILSFDTEPSESKMFSQFIYFTLVCHPFSFNLFILSFLIWFSVCLHLLSFSHVLQHFSPLENDLTVFQHPCDLHISFLPDFIILYTIFKTYHHHIFLLQRYSKLTVLSTGHAVFSPFSCLSSLINHSASCAYV